MNGPYLEPVPPVAYWWAQHPRLFHRFRSSTVVHEPAESPVKGTRVSGDPQAK
jgi:hypothetical protein